MQDTCLAKKWDSTLLSTRTATTFNALMMPWRPSMGLSPLARHHYLELTAHLYSLRRIPSWSHEWNISTVSYIGPLTSMFKLLYVTSRGHQQFLVRASHRFRHSESNQFPFQWKGTWIRFHLCWSLQGRRASPITEVHQAFTIHVAVGGHFSGTQRCPHCLSLQEKWKLRQLCDNHQGILLLVITGKILARVLLNHFIQNLEDSHLPVHVCP